MLSNPRNDKPRFAIPGLGAILAASALLALFVLSGLLSGPKTPPSIPPNLPPKPSLPQETPIRESPPAATPAEPEASPAPADGCPQGCSLPKPGCEIKGNISQENDEKIYHVPGQWYYNKTVITPEKGERWFCTEEEARANGWRKALR